MTLIILNKSLTALGLILDIIGAGLLVVDDAKPRSVKQAAEEAGGLIIGDTDAENIKIPKVQEIMNRHKKARRGLYILALGFAFQLLAVVISFFM